MTLEELHDQMLADKPESANHDSASCHLCIKRLAASLSENIPDGGHTVPDKTYTEDDFRTAIASAVAEATKDLTAEIETFKSQSVESEVEGRIEAAKAEGEAQVAELQTQLDTAVIAGEAAKNELAELKALLESEADRIAEEAQVASLIDTRTAAVLEVASFSDGYVTPEVQARWAKKSEEEFAALLDDYKAAGAKPTAVTTQIPKTTALHASRDENKGSLLSEAANWRSQGLNPRDIR